MRAEPRQSPPPSDAGRESRRQALLQELNLLDSPCEPGFDALVRTASRVCQCPIALFSLVDVDRQWFKAAVGLPATETPRGDAFCAHAVEGTDLLEVPDALADARFADNPLVVGDPNIRFYAGQPVIFDGVALGTICVIDRSARQLDADQRATLADLASAASALLQSRRQARQLAEAHAALQASERMLRGIADKLPALVCYVGRDLRYRFANEAYRAWFGFDPQTMVGRHVAELFDAQTFEGMRPFVERAHRGESVSFQRTATSDGIERHFVVEYVPDIDETGAVVGVFSMSTDVSERRAAEVALAVSEKKLLDICNNIPAVIGQFDMQQRCLFVNDVGLRVHGLQRSDLANLTFASHIDAELYEQHRSALREVLDGKRSVVYGHRQLEDKTSWFKAHLVPDFGSDDRQRGFFVMTFDITSLKTAELARTESDRRLRDITDNLPVLVSHIDADERFTYVNHAFRSSVGKTDDELIGLSVAEAIGPDLYAQRRGYIRRCLAGERQFFDVESSFQGTPRHLQTTYVPGSNVDGTAGITTLSVDVTELKLAELRLTQLAHFDTLTALPNRLHFNAEMDEAFGRVDRPGCTMAVMFLDVDHFKRVNDQHGHAVGDALLQAFARRLRGSVRATDLVARLAGDEFVVILRDVAGTKEANHIARKVVLRVGRPFIVNNVKLYVTTSVGLALREDDTIDASSLLARADLALYEAKEAGRNTYRLAA